MPGEIPNSNPTPTGPPNPTIPPRIPDNRGFKFWPLQPAQLGVELPIGGNCIKVKQASGTLTITRDKGDKDEMVTGEVVRFDTPFRSLLVTSTVPNDPVILSVGYGLKFPEIPITVIFEYIGPSGSQAAHGDRLNMFTRPSDLLDGGSAAPGGGITDVGLDGETFVAFALESATYVSGSTTDIYIQEQNSDRLFPEIIDMKTGAQVTEITAHTWYKIKVQGANFLHIGSGTIIGNGPGNAFNFSIDRGFSTWEEVDPLFQTVATGLTFNSAAPQIFRIQRPKNATQAIFYLTGTFDQVGPNAFQVGISNVNPVTGDTWYGVNGNPTGAFTAINGPINAGVDATHFQSGILNWAGAGATNPSGGYNNCVVADTFDVILIDPNAAPGAQDTGVNLLIEWVYF